MALNITTEDIKVMCTIKRGFADSGNSESAEQIGQVIDKCRDHVSRLSRDNLIESEFPSARQMLKIFDMLEAEGCRLLFVGHGLITHGRISSFSSDPDFVETELETRPLLPIPCWHWNLNTALWAIRSCVHLPGDFVELGVFKGHTVLFAQEFLKKKGIQEQNWFLYDTFDGLPEDHIDNEYWKRANTISYGKGTFSYEEVVERFEHFPETKVIKGRVPDIFGEAPLPEAICFAHIDMNSSIAEAEALELVYPRITTGGMILLDDHGWIQCIDQHKAHKDWASKQGIEILELPTGQGLIVKN